MGCDIHAWIEYRDNTDPEYLKEAYPWAAPDFVPAWQTFAQVHLGRNYEAFTTLAGVRGPENLAVVPPRGIPDNVSFDVTQEWYVNISDEGADRDEYNTVSVETASKWHESYDCKYLLNRAGNPIMVESPDWHTPSWLTADEIERAIKDVDYVTLYKATVATMRALEADKYEARLVFWFDS